jgi:hypothetical protein
MNMLAQNIFGAEHFNGANETWTFPNTGTVLATHTFHFQLTNKADIYALMCFGYLWWPSSGRCYKDTSSVSYVSKGKAVPLQAWTGP